MKVLIAYDPQNTWIRTILPGASGWFKSDGKEFKKQAENAATYYCRDANGRVITANVRDLVVVEIRGKNAKQKRENLFSELRKIASKHGKTFDRVLNFTHGHPRALNRGMVKKQHVEEYSELLKSLTHPASGIVFYSCKTGKLADGFASKVAEHTGLEVVGHQTSGHTVWNPYKRHFVPALTDCNEPSQPLMLDLWPANKADFRQHVADLKDSTTAFDFVEGALHA